MVKPFHSYKRVSIYYPKFGVYVGRSLGFDFWSLGETAGQWLVPVFDNVNNAREWLEPFYAERVMCDLLYPVVYTKKPDYATIYDLKVARPKIPIKAIQPLIDNMPS